MSTPSPIVSTLKSMPHKLAQQWIVLSVVGVVLLTYALVGFFWVPKFAREAATNYVSTTLHRQLTIGDLKFNPFTFTARASNIKLAEADGSLIASINELLVNAELSSLLHRAYTFKQVRITAPIINTVVNADGTINLAALKPTETQPATADNSLPAVRIASLELLQGELQFEDKTRPEPFSTTLKPIRFTLQNFRTQANYGNAFHFAATSEAGEFFDWQGDFTVRPLGATGQLQVRDLKAETIQAYLQDSLPFRLLSGAVSLQGNYALAMNESPDLTLSIPTIKVSNARIAPITDNAAAIDSASATSRDVNSESWVSLPSLSIDGMQMSLRQRSVTIRQVSASEAELQAWLDERHTLNLLTLLGPENKSSGPAWTFKVDAIAFDKTIVHAADHSVNPATQFTLQPVQLQVQNYSSAPGATIQLSTTLGIIANGEANNSNPGAQLEAQGTVQLDTLNTQLQVKLSQFELASLQPYVAQSTDAIINTGRLNVEGVVQYQGASNATAKNTAKNKQPSAKFSGQAEVLDLKTQDNVEHNDFIKWQQVQFKNMSFALVPDQPSPYQFSAEQIYMRQPYGRVIINPDATTNVQQVLRIKKTPQPAEDDSDKDKDKDKDALPPPLAKPDTGPPTLRVRVAKVIVDNGSVNFSDLTVKPNFAAGIQRLNGAITELSSADGSRAKIKLEGQVDSYAPVTISGEANFLAAATYSDVSMSFRNMDLTTFNPYSGKFAGYSIAKGKLTTELHYQIHDRQLDAQHHIVVDQLEFGEATESKDKVPLPIKLAAALLKDRNGVIDLNLPVGGSLDDPTFRVGPVIWKAFVGLLGRIVTSPFRALGALFGGGEELAFVDFKPGAAELDAAQVEKLDKLSKALLERPQLRLDIPMTVATDADAAALNQAAFDQALAQYLPKTQNITPQQRLTALTELYKKQLNTAPTFSTATDAKTDVKADVTSERIEALQRELSPRFAITAADRDSLTKQRAQVVQMKLLTNTELSPERIFMTLRANEASSPDGIVRMELKLE
jgi:hypothetical protein